jgi:hypothetical protein
MTYAEAVALARRLRRRDPECRIAARLIEALLRQVHYSDVFKLPPEG